MKLLSKKEVMLNKQAQDNELAIQYQNLARSVRDQTKILNQTVDQVARMKREVEAQKLSLHRSFTEEQNRLENIIATLEQKKVQLESSSDYKLLAVKKQKLEEEAKTLFDRESSIEQRESEILSRIKRIELAESVVSKKSEENSKFADELKQKEKELSETKSILAAAKDMLVRQSEDWMKQVLDREILFSRERQSIEEQRHLSRVDLLVLEDERKKISEERRKLDSERSILQVAYKVYEQH